MRGGLDQPLKLALHTRTFFVIIKLVPIAALELMASMSPIHLSWLSDVIARRHLPRPITPLDLHCGPTRNVAALRR